MIKRIIYSCSFLFFLVLSTYNVKAQIFQGTLTPQTLCYAPAGNTGSVGVVFGSPVPCNPGPMNYTWTIQNPANASSTLTPIPAVAPGTSSIANITYSGCGQYTLVCIPFCNNLPQPGQIVLYADVICPGAATISSSGPALSSTICPNTPVSFTVNSQAAATWTWSNGATGPVLNITPTASACYTATGATNTGTCPVSASACVSVQPAFVNISPVSQTVCAGTTVTLTANTTPGSGGTLKWFETAPVYLTLGSATTQTDLPAANSQYSVNFTYNTCTASATASVTIGSNLSIFASAASASVCQTETTVLTATASATSYTWVAPAPVGTLTGNTYSNVATGPGTYTVYGSNGICTGSTTVVIGQTVFTPSITASSPSVCANESFTLTGLGGAANTYTWGSFVPPVTFSILASTAPSTLVVPGQTVSTIYGFSVVSPGGCPGTATLQVFMTPNVNITASPSSGSVCAGSSVTITANGAASYTFVSSTSGTITSNSTGTLVENPVTATTYSVYGSNAAGYCISAPVVFTVNMVSGGTLTITATASAGTICPGQSANLSASGSGATNFTWSPGATLSSTIGPNVVASPNTPSSTTIYTVVGDNGGGCSGSATISVIVSSIPLVTIVSTASAVCAGFNATLTAYNAATYTWTGSSLSVPVVQQSVSVGPGTYTVVGGSAGANCPSLPQSITIGKAPDLTIITSQNHFTTCITSNYPKYSKAVTLQAHGASTYAWFPYDPAYMTYSVGTITDVRPPASTCYTVVGSTPVCTGSAVICVTVIPQFTFNVTPPQPAICYGDSARLAIVNIHTLAVGPASQFTYSWTDPPNSPPPSLTDIGTPSVIAFPKSTSTYTVQMSDSRQCASLPRLVTVTVLPQPLTTVVLPLINNVPTNTLCFVGDIPGAPDVYLVLCAQNINPGGVPSGVTPTYTWTPPYPLTSPAIVSDYFQRCVTVRAPSRTPSSVVYTVTSGYNGIPGCKRQDTVTVNIVDCRPIISSAISFTTDIGKDTICARNCITFETLTDTMAGGPQTYTWSFEGGSPSTSTLSAPVVCYDLPGTWDVILSVSNPYPKYSTPPGSTGTSYKLNYVKVRDIPNVTIVPPGQQASDTTIKFGVTIALTATNATKFVWSPNYHISALTGSVVQVNPYQTTQYIVTGYNSSKCFSSDTINVIVIEDCGDMFIPNAFSPNGDGNNDELRVRGVCLETLTFMVFNRWGEKVFETTDINNGWDGTYHGEKMNTGVFVYRLEGKTYSGRGFSLKGNVTLIR